MKPRYQIDDSWPPYVRERLLFVCKPFEHLAAGILLAVFTAGVMTALL